jgi:hypothetical protein
LAVVTSVARMIPVWVGVFAGTLSTATASPVPSV